MLQLNAQQRAVTIKIVNQRKEPVSFATVQVLQRSDSSIRLSAVADTNGVARFNLEENTQYRVLVSAVNYPAFEKGITVKPSTTAFTLVAESDTKTMAAVVIESRKPVMRQEDDKTIIEPENLAAASSSGYEVIEKTPGLFVDQDGNIYISSLTPATVQINGRDLRMSTADVATMLKSLPPTAIQRIEVVRQPSANTDAGTSGGVVNLVLRKGVKIGMTGSVNGGMQQGVYGNQFAGFNLSNNDGITNSYINLNLSRRNNFEELGTTRLFGDTVFSQQAFTYYPSRVFFASYGYSRDLNKKWNIDFAGSSSYSTSDNQSENNNTIAKGSTLLSNSDNRVQNDASSFYWTNAVQATYKIDSAGSKWTTDIYYSWSRNNTDQQYTNFFSIPALYNFGGDGSTDGWRRLFTPQTDLKLKLPQKLTMEAGLKATFLRFDNELAFFQVSSAGARSKDASRTNTFRYRENINAAYLQFSKTLGKDFVIKTGVRLENTQMKGRQFIPTDTSFNLNRTDLFPYVYLSKNIMKIMGYSLRAYLVYRRTIARPVYEQLNPSRKYIDQYLSEIGNPSLRPQFTQNLEANVSVDERPILAVGLNQTRDIFSVVTYQSDTNRTQAYRTFENLGKNKEWYFRALGALPPGGKYFLVLGMQYNYTIYDGIYEGKPLLFKKGTWAFFTYQTLRLDKRSVFTLNGFYRPAGQLQLYELGPFGALNISVNRKFFSNKLTLTLSASDLFRTNRNEFTIRQGSVNASGMRLNDTRRVGFSIRYDFGIRKKEENTSPFNAEGAEKNN